MICMSMSDIIKPDGVDEDFMSWLFSLNRRTFAIVKLGHVEYITQELVDQYNKWRSMKACTSNLIPNIIGDEIKYNVRR